MIRSVIRLGLASLGLALCGCYESRDVIYGLDASSSATDAAAGIDTGMGNAVAFAPLPSGCAPLTTPPPKTLSCTGLYGEAGAGPAAKTVHPANRPYTPGAVLYSDGADKHRWIALPAGTPIDTSDANGWVFPEGTRIWKEFAFEGKRIETRFIYKLDGTWNYSTYRWNDSESEATYTDGENVTLPSGRIHTIPQTQSECAKCHRGAPDKVLGFQQVLLGLPNAQGVDLATLVAEQRLTHPPAATKHSLPDDGTGLAAPALAYLHVNCGVSCHNESPNATSNMSHMFLRIDPGRLDDPTPDGWNSVRLTVNVPTMTANFLGGTRIVPGSPDDSAIITLAQTRGSNAAMPPIGTNYVDADGLAAVRAWIARLPGDGGVPHDASTPDQDAEVPRGLDAGNDVASAEDAGVSDVEVVDADVTADASDPGAPASTSGATDLALHE